MRKSHVVAAGAVFLCCILMTGCSGPSKAPMEYVEGVVTLDGTPVEKAFVTFSPKTPGTGEGASGYTDARGVYKLSSGSGAPEKGTTPGEYTITVTKYESVPLPKPQRSDSGDDMITHTSKNVLPKVYEKQKTSTLSATVQKGSNKIDLELKN